MSHKKVYVLETWNTGNVLCVCSSKKKLKEAIDHFMAEKYYKNRTLTWVSYGLNYLPEPLEWEWAFIKVGEDSEKLASGGGSVPNKKFFGVNLLKVKWDTDPKFD